MKSIQRWSLVCFLVGLLIPSLTAVESPVVKSEDADRTLDHRLRMIQQGFAPVATSFKPKEALSLQLAIKAWLDQFLAKASAASFDETPGTLAGFESLFWLLHVQQNQLFGAERFLQYAEQLHGIAGKYKPAKGETHQAGGLQGIWATIRRELTKRNEALAVHDRDLRVARIHLAHKVLSESTPLDQKYLAALVLDMDGDVLPALLVKDGSFSACEVEKVRNAVEQARKAAGKELLQKSRWLFSGLHWWLRGRYGTGTTGAGLMKDAEALRSPVAMFGLIMPIEPPDPSVTQQGYVDRRHHYLWQLDPSHFKARALLTQTHTKQFVPDTVSVTTTTHFY